MDTNNLRPDECVNNMEARDWKISPEGRQKVVQRIVDVLMKCSPYNQKLTASAIKKIAVNFEEKNYIVSKNQEEYLRRIMGKLQALEEKNQNNVSNVLPSNSSCSGETPSDPASHSIQSQEDKQGQSLVTQLGNESQAHQQCLSPSIQNDMASFRVQCSNTSPSEKPPASSLTQVYMPKVVGENSNRLNISGNQKKSDGNTVSQGVPSANYQRQAQGRQHPTQVTKQKQQKSLRLKQDSFQKQLQAQLLKQSKQENITHSSMQTQTQQGQLQQRHQQMQNVSKPTQLQSSKQSAMQTSSMWSSKTESAPISDIPENQQSSVQQTTQSDLKKRPQTVLQQPQQQYQILSQMPVQPLLPSEQQGQLMDQNPAVTNTQQNQLLGKQTSPDMEPEQQKLQCHNEHFQNIEQQLCQQSNVSGVRQHCQQPLGLQCINTTRQQPEVEMQGKCQQTASASLRGQGQQLQTRPLEQQLMSQSRPEKSQKSLDPLRDNQQRLSTSGTINPTSDTTHENESDWREKVYKKAQSLKRQYWTELNEMRQRLTAELKQNSVSQQLKESNKERSKELAKVLEAISLLNSPKSHIMPDYEERLKLVEKQIRCMRYSNRNRKPISLLPLGQLSSNVHHVHQPPESWSPTPQVEPPDDQKKPHLQSMNSHTSVTTIQQNNVTTMQNDSTSSLSELAAPQQNMMNLQQYMIKSEPEQVKSLKSEQQVAMGSLPSPASTPQQPTVNTLLSQSHAKALKNLHPLQSNPNILQRMHPTTRKEKQNVQAQKPRPQAQQHHIQQQLQKGQILQQQLPANLQPHEMPQHQMNEVNELKVRLGTRVEVAQHQMKQLNDLKGRQEMDVKSGGLPYESASQHSVLHHQHLKLPKLRHSAAPQILQHSSPPSDQQNMPMEIAKTGTLFRSANSPSITPPPTPLAPSSAPGDSEKPLSDVPVLSNAGNIGHQQINEAIESATPFVISTPGIPASPLLAEYHNLDEPSVFECPINRLVQMVNVMSSKALGASVSEIESVISIADRISGSAPHNRSKGEVGEDMVAMANSHLLASYSSRCNDTFGMKKMKRYKTAMPLNFASVAGGMDDSFKHFTDTERCDLESTAMSGIKRPRTEAHHVLLEEIREINQQLIDTVVDICDEDFNSTAAADATEFGEGTIVKCSFNAVAVSPTLKSDQASILLSPIRLLVPTNYPYCSPILLDKLSVEVSEEHEELAVKAKSKLNSSLRSLLQPMSLGEIARTWDFCVREVISEYAEKHGGGNFSSKYGSWENCLSAG